MQVLTDRLRLLAAAALAALIAVGVHTAIDGNRAAYSPIKDALFTMLIYLSPLVIVILAALTGRKKAVALTSACLALVVGGVVEFGYYTSHDPSKVMLLAINLVAYWICGIAALFSFTGKQP